MEKTIRGERKNEKEEEGAQESSGATKSAVIGGLTTALHVAMFAELTSKRTRRQKSTSRGQETNDIRHHDDDEDEDDVDALTMMRREVVCVVGDGAGMASALAVATATDDATLASNAAKAATLAFLVDRAAVSDDADSTEAASNRRSRRELLETASKV